MREELLGQVSLKKEQLDRAEGRLREDDDAGEAIDDPGAQREGKPGEEEKAASMKIALEGTRLKNR